MRRPARVAGVAGRSVDVPAFERLFPPGYEEQREAAEIALSQAVTVLTGGPGTGKTTTVARLLALLAEQAELAGLGAAADRAGGADRQGRGAAAGGGAAEVDKLDAADRARLAGCRRRRCTGCWAAARTRRRGSGTTAATGCRTT